MTTNNRNNRDTQSDNTEENRSFASMDDQNKSQDQNQSNNDNEKSRDTGKKGGQA